MLKTLLTSLNQKSPVSELTDADWLSYYALIHELEPSQHEELIRILSRHTGASTSLVQQLFKPQTSEQYNLCLAELRVKEQLTTAKIIDLQNRDALTYIPMQELTLTRSDWVVINSKFEAHKRHHLTAAFFYRCLTSLGKHPLNDDRVQPSRAVKEQRKPHKRQKTLSVARFFKDDGAKNPLIMDSAQEYVQLQSILQDTGVRATALSPTTSDPRYSHVLQTPGKTKVAKVCDINGFSLFKPLSPVSKYMTAEHRVDTRAAIRDKITKKLPQLYARRAAPVSFTATLALLTARAGCPREGNLACMGASASDVFRAHDIEIRPEQSRAHHWAHLIAHFLGTPELSFDDELEHPLNLVPSTAAANYNTLEEIELYISTQLIAQRTSHIRITVTPTYSDEALIPDELIYNLAWVEYDQQHNALAHNETFYIHPQSYHRFNYAMHESFAALRDNSVRRP